MCSLPPKQHRLGCGTPAVAVSSLRSAIAGFAYHGVGPFLVFPLSRTAAAQVTDQTQSAAVKLWWVSRVEGDPAVFPGPCLRKRGVFMRAVQRMALMLFVLLAPTLANAQKLTVLAVSHSINERDFTVTTPQTTNTNCSLYPNSANCNSTTYGGGSQNKAVYRFVEIVTSNEGGRMTRYTLSRTARWIWNSMDWLQDGESFPAEIKGKHMFITCRRGGNQGKQITLKYDILDIRPAQ